MSARQSRQKILPTAWTAILMILASVMCQAQCPDSQSSQQTSKLWAQAFELTPNSPTLFQWNGEASPQQPPTDSAIVTDRPDFTEASSTVGRGVLQLESGYTYSSDDDGVSRTNSHSYPEALFRYGVLADWLELRLATTFAGESYSGKSSSGARDLYIGVKLGLTPQDGFLPEMAVVPQMTLPTGHSAFTSDRVLAGVNLLYGWDINDFLSAGGSTQFNSAVDESTDNDYTVWAQSLTAGYTLTDRLSAYTEWFALVPDGADSAQVEHYGNGGFAFRYTEDIQWDIRVGTGLNSAASDMFAGVGLSLRFR
ncbi:MAG TPA: transporter [Planctomycetaceae bacterium]|nr:transporter [Planctomycetaceae bacterium]HQZ68722.1 transporter [Planctomycetaceae bacterium]